jgi:hypothetical protein
MKITPASSKSARREQAMTLTELMTATSIFLLMIAGLVVTNMFAMQQDELVNSKLGANDQSRLGFDLLLGEIRGCKYVQVGSGTSNSFTSVTNGATEQGNALLITPSTNSSTWIEYYFNTNSTNGELDRISSYATNSPTVICTGLTNTFLFQITDYTGTNLLTTSPTNYTRNYVVSVLFQFYQYQYPLTFVGPKEFYNYYKIAFKASRRAPG